MTISETEVKVRPMVLQDLDAIFSIDRKIRRMGEAITYANLTTEHIFTIDRKVSRQRQPTSYVDLITGDVAGLLELGLVAEVEGHVRGFVLGRVVDVAERAIQVGVILILGVHPDYQRRGIATQLVNAMCDRYRSEGIKTVRIGIDQRDKKLLAFFEHMGFGAGRLVDYSKTL
jgi:ribosomal protein S18 acetylase RimI-like enzyme